MRSRKKVKLNREEKDMKRMTGELFMTGANTFSDGVTRRRFKLLKSLLEIPAGILWLSNSESKLLKLNRIIIRIWRRNWKNFYAFVTTWISTGKVKIRSLSF